MSHQPYRDTYNSPDLQDYYDNVPPAHQLSNHGHNSSLSYTPAAGPPPPAPVHYNGYQGVPTYQNDNWNQKVTGASTGKRKWWIIGGVAALVTIIVIAVAVGVTVSKNNNNRSSSSSSSGSSSGTKSTGDPSVFTKDSRLHKSFYGLSYTPLGSQVDNGCTNNLQDVIRDIQIMSQMTTRIRLYGADCNQSAIVLEAIKQTKVDMQVFLGNYPIPTDNNAAYNRQKEVLKAAIETYGTDHIAGVTVGNEFLLNYALTNGATDGNSPIVTPGAEILLANIRDTRTMLDGMNLPKKMAVGTADAGSYFNNLVLGEVDYGMANVHPWFANTSAADGAAWTNEFFRNTNLAQAAALANKPQMYIAETGWPTKSSDAANARNGPGEASISSLQTFLDTFVCQANANNIGYFYFEFTDESWKDVRFGGVEGWWGLFDEKRNLKDGITIPQCS